MRGRDPDQLPTSVTHQVPIAVEMVQLGRPENPEDRHATAARAYRQGYLDASSAYLSGPSAHSNTPSFLRDLAREYPYTTIATVGALGSFTLLTSGYLASKVFRRAVGVTRTGTSEAIWVTRVDDLERRLVTQVQSSSRDRAREMDTVRREILSSLSAHATVGTMCAIEDKLADVVKQIERSSSDHQKGLHKLLSQLEANNRDRRIELNGLRTELMGELQRGSQDDHGEQLDKIFDQMVASNRDRRTELHGFRSEIMGELQLTRSTSPGPQVTLSAQQAADFEGFRTEIMDMLQRMEHNMKKMTPTAKVHPPQPGVAQMDEVELARVLKETTEGIFGSKKSASSNDDGDRGRLSFSHYRSILTGHGRGSSTR
ncbi:hypothetical protein BD324DRAFT_658250 [Kockovaella imperatae]|uniref:Uncharacterized protein n=1 Tax=Kockovaella imperatae TaxID=4999 RepID=A0A1Y1U813_9TREE|nr:hypothetical protein BD324DRAFT_658250 [Kockovaella imperatae]ORX33684.1 hypothetical protein BD324DRAFT_658250 [Kockovaella imperatae]